MRRISWKRAPSHVALALTLVLGLGCGTGQERRTFPVELTAQPMVGANERGWTVELEQARLAVGPVRFFEGRVLLSRRWPRFDLYSLIGGTAHAHPGHYVAGDAMGELLSTRTVDLLAAQPTVLGEAAAVTGDYGSMELTLATSAGDAEGLQGNALRMLGRATHTDGRVVRFEALMAPEKPIAGIRFERAMDAAPGRVRITVNLAKWLGRIDFGTVGPSSAVETSVFPTASQAQNALERGVEDTSAYEVTWMEGATQ
jgi:hypothetical protein